MCKSHHLPVPQLSHLGNDEVWTLLSKVAFGATVLWFSDKSTWASLWGQLLSLLLLFLIRAQFDPDLTESCQTSEQRSKAQTSDKATSHNLAMFGTQFIFLSLLPTLKAISPSFSHLYMLPISQLLMYKKMSFLKKEIAFPFKKMPVPNK